MASVREVKQPLDETSEQRTGSTEESSEAADGELHNLRAKLRANGARLEDDLRDAGARFADGAKKFSEAAAEQVRENPLAAFGIAFAAGIVVSRWLRRR
jgi:ElaB/YqjD/DUF883 family membrane-anchored ribosome-binding protein